MPSACRVLAAKDGGGPACTPRLQVMGWAPQARGSPTGTQYGRVKGSQGLRSKSPRKEQPRIWGHGPNNGVPWKPPGPRNGSAGPKRTRPPQNSKEEGDQEDASLGAAAWKASWRRGIRAGLVAPGCTGCTGWRRRQSLQEEDRGGAAPGRPVGEALAAAPPQSPPRACALRRSGPCGRYSGLELITTLEVPKDLEGTGAWSGRPLWGLRERASGGPAAGRA
ncbi:uncharacterized protein LOC119529950 [Choloepus didactylus]|uniref:uncharacterized protein LOC119529950 n=1 Tax=Choloepus didactylus TaxID=27675 RepID=UPI0018A002EA|nr:uncharacterized protein LOC119529950 [Choloepus didactylus]